MKTLDRAEFEGRRRQLLELMEPNSIAVIAAAPEVIRNRDCEYPYRQHSDFWYLTGFNEPESVLVVLSDAQGHGRSILFCRDRDLEQEIWHGYRAGQAGAVADYGFDEAHSMKELASKMVELINGRERIYAQLGRCQQFDQSLLGWVKQVRAQVRKGFVAPNEIVGLDKLLHDLRLYKSPAEIALMRTAGDISARAHCRAMQLCQPGQFEYQLEAELLHEFVRSGARFPAYNSIVAAGVNACVLHYTENHSQIADGDLVLIDAGAELDGYSSDITRTFPANGRFSGEQKALYDIVLEANVKAVAAVKADNHWNTPHEVALKILTQGLVDLGILKGEVDSLIEDEAYKPYYMHRTGHWLGLDVHDVGEYKIGGQWRLFEPGMTLTIEPGLYIGQDADCDERWRGIGIRIEDDVLVTLAEPEIFTGGVPKDIAAIEALMAEK